MRIKARFTKTKTAKYLHQYQIDYIKENAATLTPAQLATVVGKNTDCIYDTLRKLKLKPLKAIFQKQPVIIPPCIEE